MYFSDPKDQAEFDARTSEIGVMIEDRKGKIGREIRESLHRGDILFLRKKQRFNLKEALDSRNVV